MKSHQVKTLEISWRAHIDCFAFKVEVEHLAHPTKRSVLSAIARLFDQLGLVGLGIAIANTENYRPLLPIEYPRSTSCDHMWSNQNPADLISRGVDPQTVNCGGTD
ncbi:hypothetical protein CEXT_331401 [Caerostris extrusa]|uniref:Uncharacterized protein n=1 Tax=Caerostris extrusa TaxID=172846 RepID=A0AAV4NP31_CAEEX|nr:hypothetical protein CEXT_331401 [Caerostris extrusa]